MAGTIEGIKNKVKQGDILVWLILINLVVFILPFVFTAIGKWFHNVIDIEHYIVLYSDLHSLLCRPWTLLTYMFGHDGILHILFNMFFLYVFGRFFLMFFTPKNLGSLYILGGLGGGIIYLLFFNLIPYFVSKGNVPLIGASASVMAISFAAIFYRPNMEVRLFLFGNVKLVYIAFALLAYDIILLLMDNNPGGHIAHLGGALVGYIYANQYLKGKDITRWLTNVIDKVINLFKRSPKKPKMKVKYKKAETDYEYNQRKASEQEIIDEILDKIKASGYSSLSKEEKKKLFDASKK